MGKHYCELCWGISDSCPNDDTDEDFEELLDYKLNAADDYNDEQFLERDE